VGRSAAAAATGEVHGFPAALTSFIGRAGAVREVAGLLAECRLVTVTGPGGAGKTRLAGQMARQVAGRFADGAWLAGMRDPVQVAAVVATALGIPEQSGISAAEVLARLLARRQLLPVLDNAQPVAASALPSQVRRTARGGACLPGGHLAAAQYQQGRDGPGAEPLRDLRRGADVHLDQLDLTRQIAGELLERGADHPAGPAPGRPQADDDRDPDGQHKGPGWPVNHSKGHAHRPFSGTLRHHSP
jgi:hypothetical protein